MAVGHKTGKLGRIMPAGQRTAGLAREPVCRLAGRCRGFMVAGGLGNTWWAYPLLFLAVGASWAGVPVIGSAALGTAAVAASQNRLNLAAAPLWPCGVTAGTPPGAARRSGMGHLTRPHNPASPDSGTRLLGQRAYLLHDLCDGLGPAGPGTPPLPWINGRYVMNRSCQPPAPRSSSSSLARGPIV